jgi:hypothetical protein
MHVQFEGVIDVGSCKGPHIKRLLKITSEPEWNDYKAVVLASEVRSLDLVITKEYGIGIENTEACPSFNARIENGRSVEEEIVLTQPTYGSIEGLGSAKGDEGCCDGDGDDHENAEADGDDNHDSDDDDDSYVVGKGEGALDDASEDDLIDDDLIDKVDISGEDDFGDARATNRFDMEVAGDDETFLEDIVKDSDNDRPVHRLNDREIEILRRVLPLTDPLVPDFEDLSHGHRAVADVGPSDTIVPDVSWYNIIRASCLLPWITCKLGCKSTPLCTTVQIHCCL